MNKGVTHAHLKPIWYHSEPSDVPYSPNQFLGWDFFCRFLQQDSSNINVVRGCSNFAQFSTTEKYAISQNLKSINKKSGQLSVFRRFGRYSFQETPLNCPRSITVSYKKNPYLYFVAFRFDKYFS